jgi:hypothetical protein
MGRNEFEEVERRGVILMARPAQVLQEDRLLRTYIRGLVHEGGRATPSRSPGHEARTCAHCGQWTLFRLDPDGVWTTCSACGRYA